MGSPTTAPARAHHDGVRTAVVRRLLLVLGFVAGGWLVSALIAGAAAAANVWDFVAGSHHTERGPLVNRFGYDRILGGALRALLQTHAYAFEPPAVAADTAADGTATNGSANGNGTAPPPPLPASLLADMFSRPHVTLRAYDDAITSPLYGFRGADDYYARISSARFAPHVRIPLLALNAADDPIVGPAAPPLREALASPWLVIGRTAGGGHLGWFERAEGGGKGRGGGGGVRRWYVRPVGEFLGALREVRGRLTGFFCFTWFGRFVADGFWLRLRLRSRLARQYGLAPRPRPTALARDADGFVRQAGREDVGFREVALADVLERLPRGAVGAFVGDGAEGAEGDAEGEKGEKVKKVKQSRLFSGW